MKLAPYLQEGIKLAALLAAIALVVWTMPDSETRYAIDPHGPFTVNR